MTYSSVAYDALWIAAKSMDKNSTTNTKDGDFSIKDFNEILVDTAESFNGVTGEINLNMAGDRISENYDFWQVAKDDMTNEFKWQANFQDYDSDH
jgi:ABC-type branched-subunit amino acid transport system substrate-binding protein